MNDDTDTDTDTEAEARADPDAAGPASTVAVALSSVDARPSTDADPAVQVGGTAHYPAALLLLHASRWFDEQLLTELARRGWPRLTSAQSLVFPHLDYERGVSYSELARSLGHSRQATHELVGGLERLGLIASAPDPDSGRRRHLTLTKRGRQMTDDARDVLAALERQFASADLEHLHRILGPVVHGRQPRS